MVNKREKFISTAYEYAKEISRKLGWLPFALGLLLALGLFGAYFVQEQSDSNTLLPRKNETSSLKVHSETITTPLFEGERLLRLNTLLSTGQEMEPSEVEGLFSKNKLLRVSLQRDKHADLLIEFDPNGNYYRIRPLEEEYGSWKYYRSPTIGQTLTEELKL